MSWIERAVEQRLADAAANGELDVADRYKGKPIPGIDEHRPHGTWVERFVERELSHDRRQAAVQAAASARVGFWQAATIDDLRDRVRTANAAIDKANINLVAADQLEPFELHDVEGRWRALRIDR